MGGGTGIAPFYLYRNFDRPYLCPVNAWCMWYKINRMCFPDGGVSGYVLEGGLQIQSAQMAHSRWYVDLMLGYCLLIDPLAAFGSIFGLFQK